MPVRARPIRTRRALAALLFLLTLAPGLPVTQAAIPGVSVLLDGNNLTFDVPPVIRNDRTLVPLRAIFEALQADVQWVPETRTVLATTATSVIQLQIDRTEASVNGRPVPLDVAPTIVDDRTMVPVRFVAEALGAEVKYDAATRTVLIASPETKMTPEEGAGAGDVPPGWFRVSGLVRNAGTGEPIPGAKIVAKAGGPLPFSYDTTAGEDGSYRIDLPEAGAPLSLTVSSPCYQPEAWEVSRTTRMNLDVSAASLSLGKPLANGYYRVFGVVRDESGKPLSGVCITAKDLVAVGPDAGQVAQSPVSPPDGKRRMLAASSGRPPDALGAPGRPDDGTTTGETPPVPPDSSVTAYLTGADGLYFLDLPQWRFVKVEATRGGCGGVGFSYTFAKRVGVGEGGPRLVVPGVPAPIYIEDIQANPRLQKDINMVCQKNLAVTIPAGGTGVTICQATPGTPSPYGSVRVSASAGAITTGQRVEVTASPEGDQSEVALRWWLDDHKGGTLYANGCTATYKAPASLGLAYQTSAYVLVAKDGATKPWGGQGSIRIMIYDARNGPQSGTGGGGSAGGSTCGAAPLIITASDQHGLITRVEIKGVGAWWTLGARTVTVPDVPIGSYTVWVTTTATGTHTLRTQVGCPVTRSLID